MNYLRYIETASLEDKINILRKKWGEIVKLYSKIKDTDVEYVWGLLLNTDSTKNKQYLQWIITKGISGWKNKDAKTFNADLSRITENLELFELCKKKNKLKPEHKDINRIPSNEVLFTILQEYNSDEIESNCDKKNEMEQSFYNKKAAILYYDSSTLKVVIPKTKEASCYFGVNTQWCTAAKNNNQFRYYNSKGTLYIFLDKAKNERYQFWLGSSKSNFQYEFMNERDEEVKISDIQSIKDAIRKIIEKLILKSFESNRYSNRAVLNFMWLLENRIDSFDLYEVLFKKASRPNIKINFERLISFFSNKTHFLKLKKSNSKLYHLMELSFNLKKFNSVEEFLKTVQKSSTQDIATLNLVTVPNNITFSYEDMIKLFDINPFYIFAFNDLSFKLKEKYLNRIGYFGGNFTNILNKIPDKNFFNDLKLVKGRESQDFHFIFHLSPEDVFYQFYKWYKHESMLAEIIHSRNFVIDFGLEKLRRFLKKYKEDLSPVDKVSLLFFKNAISKKLAKFLEKENLIPKTLYVAEFIKYIETDSPKETYEICNWFNINILDVYSVEDYEQHLYDGALDNVPDIKYNSIIFNKYIKNVGLSELKAVFYDNILDIKQLDLIDFSDTSISNKMENVIKFLFEEVNTRSLLLVFKSNNVKTFIKTIFRPDYKMVYKENKNDLQLLQRDIARLKKLNMDFETTVENTDNRVIVTLTGFNIK